VCFSLFAELLKVTQMVDDLRQHTDQQMAVMLKAVTASRSPVTVTESHCLHEHPMTASEPSLSQQQHQYHRSLSAQGSSGPTTSELQYAQPPSYHRAAMPGPLQPPIAYPVQPALPTIHPTGTYTHNIMPSFHTRTTTMLPQLLHEVHHRMQRYYNNYCVLTRSHACHWQYMHISHVRGLTFDMLCLTHSHYIDLILYSQAARSRTGE